MTNSRHSATRRETLLWVVTAWVVLVTTPCSMASVFNAETAADMAAGFGAGQEVVSHENCLTPPPADSAPESDDCCVSLPAVKSDGVRPPDAGSGMLAPWPPSHLSPFRTTGTTLAMESGPPPGSHPAVYLATLRLRI